MIEYLGAELTEALKETSSTDNSAVAEEETFMKPSLHNPRLAMRWKIILKMNKRPTYRS